jgi:pyruvate/2-oxoglutarate dehydrogenase complex dihydrolipoamide acyltransferase (E2) component
MADAAGGPTDLMSISDLRDALAQAGDEVERSVLSRYVNKHALVRRREGRRALCSFEQVSAHRRRNYDREIMGGATSPAQASVAEPETAAPAASPPAEIDASLDERRREKRAKAMMAELELARELGLVVERAEVEAGMAAAVGAWARFSAAAVNDAADTLVADLELPPTATPAVRLGMKRFVNTLRGRLAVEFRRIAGELGDGDAAEGADARLDDLIEHAKRLCLQDAKADAAESA